MTFWALFPKSSRIILGLIFLISQVAALPYTIDYVNYPEVTDSFTAIDYGLTTPAALSGFTTGNADYFVCKAEGIVAQNRT